MKKRLLFGALCLVLLWTFVVPPASASTIEFARVRSVSDLIALQTTATTGAGNIVDLHHRLSFVSVWIIWNGTCTAGVAEVQVAMTTSGPWRTIATLTHDEDGADKTDVADWVDWFGSPGALRVNITTPVTGGTVTAEMTGW